MKLKILTITFILLIIPLTNISGAELDNYFFQTSFYTSHYSDGLPQNNDQNLIGLERHYKNESLDGLVYFQNTYSQNTWYIYWGKNYTLHNFGKFSLTAKFTYGIIHGYDDENGKYRTWMHRMETFPGAVFSFGIRHSPFRFDIVPFADAGIIITGGIEF